MILFAKAYHLPTDLIGFGSVIATVAVTLLAYAVRAAPERQRSGLTFLLPYLLLIAAAFNVFPALHPLPANSWFAFTIFAASAFGFALANFRFPERIHHVNGVISGLVVGLCLTFTGALSAFKTGSLKSHNPFAFWAPHAVFLLCWTIVCLGITARKRNSDRSSSDKPKPPT